MLKKMICNIAALCFLAAWPLANASQANLLADNVAVSAKAVRVSETEVDLTVTATIRPGLHIYALSQVKPILATKIDVAKIDSLLSIGTFTQVAEPERSIHPDLGIELLEHHDQAEWKSRIVIKPGQSVVSISGSLFAQACENDRCFAPQSYAFSVEVPEALVTVDVVSQERTETNSAMSADVSQPSKIEFTLSDLNLAAQQQQSQSIWTVLPLAFVAGFLLNFMPCVLPVVGLKLLSFVQQANSDRRRILLMNIAYTSGLIFVMLVLATFAAFAGLGWGQQFSSAAFTVTMSALVFAFGLSFLGVWEFPVPGFVGTVGGKRPQEGYTGAFSKGILSTLLATPCSGPFLGAALAWAVTQPAYLTYLVFSIVGLGMASPYLVIGAFPSMIRFLPKPGNWMIVFKQVMGFVMLATVVYLMSFMPIASVVPTVLLLLGIGVALWYAGQTPAYESTGRLVRAWSAATVMVIATAFLSFGWLQGVMQARFERAAQRLIADVVDRSNQLATKTDAGKRIQWEDYSPDRLEMLLQSETSVFIDFTADWCLTCKANEAVAIETNEVAEAIRSGNVIAIKADKTEPNPAADELLRRLGNSAASIPFYAVFPAGRPNEPVLLDGLYSSPEPFANAIRGSIKKAGPGSDNPDTKAIGFSNRDSSTVGG